MIQPELSSPILKNKILKNLQKKSTEKERLKIEEISLPPALSSPPRLRIQGGYPERDGQSLEILCLI